MSNNEKDAANLIVDDEIDIGELFDLLWGNKFFITLWTSLFMLVSIVYSLTLTNLYTARTLLAPSSSGQISSNLSQYSGLASIAGITLPKSGEGISDKDLAISLLKSKGLLQRLINKYDILPNLIAAENWNLKTNSINYNSNIYDETKRAWVRKVKPPFKSIPSTQEAYVFFDEAISIVENSDNGTISLEVDHISPEIAYDWSLILIQEVNEYVADMRINEAQLSINYLNDQIKITPYPDLRALFYELIQQHTQSMMLAKVRPEYALTTIDPPLIPKTKSSPNRALIIALTSFFGVLSAIFTVFIRYYLLNLKDSFLSLEKAKKLFS